MLDFEVDQHIVACQDALARGRGAPLSSCKAKDATKALETERQWFQEARRTVCFLADGSQESAVLALSQAMAVRLDGDVLPWVESGLQELLMSPEFLKTGLVKVVDTSERPVI